MSDRVMRFMLCLYQNTSMVNWSDDDHFAWDNYDSLSIASILKQNTWHYIFPKHPKPSQDTVRQFPF